MSTLSCFCPDLPTENKVLCESLIHCGRLQYICGHGGFLPWDQASACQSTGIMEECQLCAWKRFSGHGPMTGCAWLAGWDGWSRQGDRLARNGVLTRYGTGESPIMTLKTREDTRKTLQRHQSQPVCRQEDRVSLQEIQHEDTCHKHLNSSCTTTRTGAKAARQQLQLTSVDLVYLVSQLCS